MRQGDIIRPMPGLEGYEVVRSDNHMTYCPNCERLQDELDAAQRREFPPISLDHWLGATLKSVQLNGLLLILGVGLTVASGYTYVEMRAEHERAAAVADDLRWFRLDALNRVKGEVSEAVGAIVNGPAMYNWHNEDPLLTVTIEQEQCTPVQCACTDEGEPVYMFLSGQGNEFSGITIEFDDAD